jgi:hypothetical protein
MIHGSSEAAFRWLEIRNFRSLDYVRLESLGQVNLIVGKNNVGKTTLLEAIRFYSTGGAPWIVWDILSARDELLDTAETSEAPDPAASPFLALFPGRQELADIDSVIRIDSDKGPMEAMISWFSEDPEAESPVARLRPTPRPESGQLKSLIPALVVSGRSRQFIRLDTEPRRTISRFRESLPDAVESCAYVGSNGVPPSALPFLWDKIVLTEAEPELIQSLQFLMPGLERLSFVGSERRTNRAPKAKVKGFAKAVPFRSLGDGVNRALGILLTLAASKAGSVLLVDEVENGIHYSAQDELWRLLIDAASRFKIQIFATTHSSDCIRAFQRATAAVPGPTGVLIRLENRAGRVVASQFDEDELRIAESERIEVR